jgi:hypothetical protein
MIDFGSFADITAMGILAVVLVLGFSGGSKLFAVLSNHLERQNQLLVHLHLSIEALSSTLTDIQESLQKPDKT